MKNFENPEYFIFHELLALQKKYPDFVELDELIERVKRIINENNLYIVKNAMLYTLLGEEELTPGTEEKLKNIYKNALDTLEQKKHHTKE